MRQIPLARLAWFVMLACVLAPQPAPGQFCGTFAQPPTLAEQIGSADAVVVARWLRATSKVEEDSGSTDFELVTVLSDHDLAAATPGQLISVSRFFTGEPGDTFLLMGSVDGDEGDEFLWDDALPVTPRAARYALNLPRHDEPVLTRLWYCLRHLESDDSVISDDAYREFHQAPFEDVAMLARDLPREKLRMWVQAPATSRERLGLYGMMLGLCGTVDDARMMERKILEPAEDFRLGIDGVMCGYLMLAKDKGLSLLDEKKLKDKEAPFSEVYAAMQALRFMRHWGDNRIEADRLRQSMRILLDRPNIADLAIAELSRMQDWSIQDQLMDLYATEAYDIPSIKRAIVRFMVAAERDTGTTNGEAAADQLPGHVDKARKCLEELKKRDPKTVDYATRSNVPKF